MIILFSHFYFTLCVLASLDSYLPQPKLYSNAKFYAMDGNNITMTCSITLSSYMIFTMDFIYDGEKIVTDDNHIVTNIHFDGNNKLRSHKNLTIINVKESRDEGEYECIVQEYGNVSSNFVMEALKFVDETSIYVKLNPHNPHIEIYKSQKSVKFLIAYEAFPKPTIFIFNPKNETVSIDEEIMNRSKYDVKINFEKIELIIKNPDINDFGDFIILAKCIEKNFTTSVKLIVSDKPTVKINDTSVLVGKTVIMICEVDGYPASNITWGKLCYQKVTKNLY